MKGIRTGDYAPVNQIDSEIATLELTKKNGLLLEQQSAQF